MSNTDEILVPHTSGACAYVVTDPAVLWRAAVGDLEAFRMLSGIYLEQAPPLQRQLQAALDGIHLDQAASASHALKGMAGLIGATALSALLQQIEQGARQGVLPPAPALAGLCAQVMQEVAHSSVAFLGPEAG